MCGGVKYKHEGQTVTACFPNPKAAQCAVHDRWPRIIMLNASHA